VLTDLFKNRGVKLDRTYQLNTDFLNVLERLVAKKKRSSSWSVSSAGPEKQETKNASQIESSAEGRRRRACGEGA